MNKPELLCPAGDLERLFEDTEDSLDREIVLLREIICQIII